MKYQIYEYDYTDERGYEHFKGTTMVKKPSMIRVGDGPFEPYDAEKREKYAAVLGQRFVDEMVRGIMCSKMQKGKENHGEAV